MINTEKQKTLVIGHRNPDTDSICSAICYAALKRTLTGKEYEPCRAGNVNPETQFVLDFFQVEAPRLVESVKTQVKDIEIRKTKGVDRGISLKTAWSLMQENNVVTIPCVTEEGVLEGVITIGDITKSYMNLYDSSIISKANTKYSNILDTLEGSIVVGDAEAYFDKGKVLIAAANPDLMENYIEKHDLVILGNRYESQLCAIEMEAGCIIVCEGAGVSLTIRKLAQERGCTVITTPYDTYTTARLINQSMPISYFMTMENIIGFSDEASSSASKGESVSDTIRIISCYADICAMRHPKEGAPMVAAEKSLIPVINAGDGGHQHPTQTLTDLLTIKSLKGRLGDMTVGLCGDLKFGRTVHSLIHALVRYPGIRFVLISPPELKVPDYIKENVLDANHIPYRETTNLDDAMEELDILYMTRVQRERFFNEEDYVRLKDFYILTAKKMKLAPPDMLVLHPLPRVNEISVDVDDDPRAVYFKQVQYAVYVRMALILTLLNIHVD